MEKQEKNVPNVKLITSLATAVNDVNDVLTHIQIVICQDVDTLKWNCYFDVVDPSKIHLADDGVSASDPA